MFVGHQRQWRILTKLAEQGRLPQALLFSGEEQIGKRMVAVALARFLVCEQPKKNAPCNTCKSCQDTARNQHPDYFFVGPETGQGTLPIATVRELVTRLSTKPVAAPLKIAVIDQAHRMMTDAQNAFLKFLEEPRGQTVVMLVTDYPQLLLSTVRSRVQQLSFSRLKDKEITQFLQEHGMTSSETLRTVTALSFGKPGRVHAFLYDAASLKQQQTQVAELRKLMLSDIGFRFQYAKKLADLGPESRAAVLDLWLRSFRSLLLAKIGARQTPHQDILQRYSGKQLTRLIGRIQSMQRVLAHTSVNPKLALETIVMEF